MSSSTYTFGPFVLDVDRQTLTRESRHLSVNARGVALLAELVRANGRPVSRSALMGAAWPGVVVEDGNLSVQIAILRKLLGSTVDGAAWIITVPRIGYRFASNHECLTGEPPAGVGSARTSIVVVPLENVGGNRERDYLADGITDDIIAALARFRWFSVASRGTSFSYRQAGKDSRSIGRELDAAFLLEGSVRQDGLRTRISVQLVETANGTTLWSEQYDLAQGEIFAIQDAIAERVVGSVEPELLRHDAMRVAHHTGNLSAWDLVRRGTWHFHKVTSSTHEEARRLFREASELDPALAEAQLWLARACAGLIGYGWSSDAERDGREGLDAALRAIYLDGQNPYTHYSLAILSANSGRLPQAMLAAERAIDLSPSFALGHLALGMARLFAGEARAAIDPLNRGLRFNPHDPQNAFWFNLLALAHLFAGDTHAALEATRAGLKTRPDSATLATTLSLCLVANGDKEEAHRMAKLAASLPLGPPDGLGPLRDHNPEWARYLLALHAEAEHR